MIPNTDHHLHACYIFASMTDAEPEAAGPLMEPGVVLYRPIVGWNDDGEALVLDTRSGRLAVIQEEAAWTGAPRVLRGSVSVCLEGIERVDVAEVEAAERKADRARAATWRLVAEAGALKEARNADL